ncbi:50S ribosomal protein L18e [Nanoarchaeota archaeon]
MSKNIYIKKMIEDLKKVSYAQKVNIWRRIADDLEKPTRTRRIVNLFKLNIYTKDGETVIVPGKVLGTGDLNHKVTIAAWTFSESAKEKIKQAKGECLSIPQLIEKNPKGKDVRIIG